MRKDGHKMDKADCSCSCEQYRDKNGCYMDHLGNYYSSVQKMCDCWEVSYKTFGGRLWLGWSLEKALTYDNARTKPKKDAGVVWVFGLPFQNYNAVDRAYGFDTNTSRKHKDNLEEWLLSEEQFYVDGKLFRTKTALGMEYGLSETTLHYRLKSGWTIEDAVHTPTNGLGRRPRSVTDHLGNRYESINQMVMAYGISYSSYVTRTNRGWGLEKTLTTPMRKVKSKTPTESICNAG